MTGSSPARALRYRRHHHVDVRRPYPQVTAAHQPEKAEQSMPKVYPCKPRGRRCGELVKKMLTPFSWSHVGQ